mmetsp:Transcript_37704/g.121184  ORF Transcript_37704/g.121184 Transcript_37704/m.121184 type:complete len:236 (+) Transcript_37704:658-1365(+)
MRPPPLRPPSPRPPVWRRQAPPPRLHFPRSRRRGQRRPRPSCLAVAHRLPRRPSLPLAAPPRPLRNPHPSAQLLRPRPPPPLAPHAPQRPALVPRSRLSPASALGLPRQRLRPSSAPPLLRPARRRLPRRLQLPPSALRRAPHPPSHLGGPPRLAPPPQSSGPPPHRRPPLAGLRRRRPPSARRLAPRRRRSGPSPWAWNQLPPLAGGWCAGINGPAKSSRAVADGWTLPCPRRA